MVRFGKVMSIDKTTNTGIIRDQRGRDFFFYGYECENDQLPPLYSVVSFIKDEDFKSTNVACLIKIKQLPRAI